MKRLITSLLLLSLVFPFVTLAQKQALSDIANGDWTLQHIILEQTPEADLMIRSGDIDNLGFGWPTGFDPFTGMSTPAHSFPWTVDTANAMGTDRIMVISSYNGNAPYGTDGYTGTTSRPENLPRPIVLNFELKGMEVSSAALQVFVDDFQAPVWQCNYTVSINGQDAPFMADLVNTLSQTGPIGKIISVNIPPDYLYLLQSDSLSVLFDDHTSGGGDGYAVDFVKLLINIKGFTYTSNMFGYITDLDTGDPVSEAIVSASGTITALTDAAGYFYLSGVPSGITLLSVTKFSYDTASILVDIEAGSELGHNFQIKKILDAEFQADITSGDPPFTAQFTDMTSLNPNSWLWDFGDGSSSDLQNPTHTYASKGAYTVMLTASNGIETSTEKKTNYIKVGNVGTTGRKYT